MCSKKVALVTGTSSGIGRAVAGKYESEGYIVCGIDKNVSSKKIGFNEFCCDIANVSDVKNTFSQIKKIYPAINYVINCAGIFFDQNREWIENMTIGEWKKVIDTNITGTMLITQNAISLLTAAEGDRAIVNISSDQAIHPRKKNSAYAVSKAGVDIFSKASAVELLEKGIRVNSVLPASVRTNFIRRLVKDSEHMDKIYEKENEKMPLGIIEPEEVADLVFFLGSEKSRKITGQSIMIDSGLYI